MGKYDRNKATTDDKQGFYDMKAHQTGNLQHFLKPYFLFRAYIVFKSGKKFHAYGNEHQCTYNQLRFGRVDNILLDRNKGYTDLVNMIEKRYAGKYTRAHIYMRKPGEDKFNILCRDYDDKEELAECQDPVIPEEHQFKTLYYYTHQGLVIVTETDPAGENFKTDL